MDDIVIRLEQVSRIFSCDGVETRAPSDIDLEIRHGDYLSIAGPSGCGKSTLLSILGLFDSPTISASRLALLSQEGSTIETAVEIVRGVVPKA